MAYPSGGPLSSPNATILEHFTTGRSVLTGVTIGFAFSLLAVLTVPGSSS